MSSSGKSKTIGKAATPPVQRSAAQPAKDTSVAKPVTASADVQRKLEVGSPNDVYEQQADAMAEQVVKMTEADVAAKKQQAPKNKSRTAVQAKAQPGAFLFRKASPMLAPKTEEKLQKAADPELKKKADEKLQKAADPELKKKADEKLQKAADPELKKKADEKLQKAADAELKKKADEKLQKAADPELKKKADEKLQKAADPELKKKADEKLQKAADPELKKKADEKLQKAADAELKKKADEKLQKAADAELKKKADEKLQKAADAELKKKSEEKQQEIKQEQQKIAFEAGQKIKKKASAKEGEEKIQQTIQRKNAQEQQRQVSNAQVTQQVHEPKQRSHEVTEKDLRRKPEQKEEEKIKKKDEPLKKKAEEKPQKKSEEKVQQKAAVKVQKQAIVQLVRTITPAPPAPRRTAKEEDKIKKKAEEKPQKKTEEKVQKSAEKVATKPLVARTILPKEDDKLKKKADEKLQKATEEKVQKAEEPKKSPEKIQQSRFSLTTAATVQNIAKKEDDKIKRKAESFTSFSAVTAQAGNQQVAPVQRKATTAIYLTAEKEKIGKKEDVLPEKKENQVNEKFETLLNNRLGGGSALPPAVKNYMEPRFGVNFSRVRIHNDQSAHALSRDIGAQAFAYKNHIFFNTGKYQPETESGRFLLAHELTHVIQQGYAAETDAADPAKAPAVAPKKETVQRNVEIKNAPPSIQRVGIRDSLAALAANIPGWTLLTLVIGRNPINNEVVDRNALNVLRAFMGLIPGGEMLFQVLSSYGIMEKIATWTEQQVDALGITASALGQAFDQFIEGIDPLDIFSPGSVWERAKNIFTPFITRIENFVSSLISQAIAWLKEKFMKPLSEFCVQIPGYKLVTVLLGNDPFTNEAVPATAMNVVKAFAEFIPGGTEKVKELEESKGLQKAYDWFIQETTARNLTWARIAGTFATAWNSLKLEDVLEPVATLQRIGATFSPLFTDLVGFAQAALMKLLEIIYEAVMGAGGSLVLSIIKKSAATFKTIIQNPVGFLGNLVTAVGMGIRQFGGNILKHLQTGVITWLTGTLTKGGIQLPEQWDLKGILKLVMQVLGLTWPRIRGVAVEVFGAKVVDGVEKVAGFVMDIKEKGFIQTIKDRINEYFTGLKEMVLGKIKSFIQEKIVMAGIAQLVSLLSPVGAVIQAIIKTYQTVMFFIQKINQILQFVNSVVDSIASIANGSLGAAASYIEQTMARTIPLILDFLARMIGLGDISGKIKSAMEAAQNFIMGKIRQGMTAVKNLVMKLFQSLLQAGAPTDPKERLKKGMQAAKAAVNKFAGKKIGKSILNPLLNLIKTRYQFQELTLTEKSGKWSIYGKVNPDEKYDSNSEVDPLDGKTPEFTQSPIFTFANSKGTSYQQILAKLRSVTPRLFSADNEIRKAAVKQIREKDKVWTLTQGAIYMPHITAQQEAILELQEKAIGTFHLIGIERGGGILGDQIKNGKITRGSTIEKPVSESKGEQMAMLSSRIASIVSSNPGQILTISIAETIVGGGSVNGLLDSLIPIASIYKHVNFRVLALQQTINNADFKSEGVSIRKTTAVEVCIAQTPYILGEDVAFQLAKDSKQPITLYTGSESNLKAVQITPQGEATSRDLIVALAKGKIKVDI